MMAAMESLRSLRVTPSPPWPSSDMLLRRRLGEGGREGERGGREGGREGGGWCQD